MCFIKQLLNKQKMIICDKIILYDTSHPSKLHSEAGKTLISATYLQLPYPPFLSEINIPANSMKITSIISYCSA